MSSPLTPILPPTLAFRKTYQESIQEVERKCVRLASQIEMLGEEMQNLQAQFSDLQQKLHGMQNQQLPYTAEFMNLLKTTLDRDSHAVVFALLAAIFVFGNDLVIGIFRQVAILFALLLIIIFVKTKIKESEKDTEMVIQLKETIQAKNDVGKKTDENKEYTGTVISIDLGTTNASVGVYKNGRTEIIKNDQGKTVTPFYVAFTADGERLIGDAAKSQLTTNPENTIYNVKDLMGREWNDPIVQDSIEYFSFKVVERNGKPHIEVRTEHGKKKIFAPEEITAMVISHLKETAERRLGEEVSRAVIAVPANFNGTQRQAVKDAAAISGLTVLRLINAPSAAAITYGLGKEGKKIIVVYDLGGGKFDVTLLEIENGVFKVKSTDGDAHLGGENFDRNILKYFIKPYKNAGKDIREYKQAFQRLRVEIEKAKIALSDNEQAEIEIKPFIDGQDFTKTLSRGKFEELNKNFFKKTVEFTERCLAGAQLSSKDVDEIILIGGSSRIPKIRQIVKDLFDGKELYLPDSGVVLTGVAELAAAVTGDDEAKPIDLNDIKTLSLGINTIGDIMSVIIPRDTSLPTKKSENYTTTYDNQTVVSIKVYEGESSETKDNHFLDEFELNGIKPAPRHVPRIKVTFEMDSCGILHVTAQDEGTGNKKQIDIDYGKNRLTGEDIDRMIKNVQNLPKDDNKI